MAKISNGWTELQKVVFIDFEAFFVLMRLEMKKDPPNRNGKAGKIVVELPEPGIENWAVFLPVIAPNQVPMRGASLLVVWCKVKK